MKHYLNLFRQAALATAILLVATSCSDEEEKSFSGDIYFTGFQQDYTATGYHKKVKDGPLPPVIVVGPSNSSVPEVGIAALNICFDAASTWQIAAKEILNPGQDADWVDFYFHSGESGSQRLGVYVTANTSDHERAAFIEVSCNGKHQSFTLVQQARVPVINPNSTAINKAKTISKIEYCDPGESSPAKAVTFSYNTDGILTYQTTALLEDGLTTSSTKYAITTDFRPGGSTGGITKFYVTRADHTTEGEMFAIVNGQVITGYKSLTLNSSSLPGNIKFSYEEGFLKSISGQGVETILTWDNGNLTDISSADTHANVIYGDCANDCNLDLNWFVGLESASTGLNSGNEILAVMNLIGRRSANLVSSANGEIFTYTPGVTDSKGEETDGITVTTSTNRTIKIYLTKK